LLNKNIKKYSKYNLINNKLYTYFIKSHGRDIGKDEGLSETADGPEIFGKM